MQSIVKHLLLRQQDFADLENVINIYKNPTPLYYEAFCQINQGKNIKQVISDIKNSRFGYNSDQFDAFKEKQEITDALLNKPPEIREGENECPKCKQKKTLIVETQTRSADEGFTYYIHCFNQACKAITKS